MLCNSYLYFNILDGKIIKSIITIKTLFICYIIIWKRIQGVFFLI